MNYWFKVRVLCLVSGPSAAVVDDCPQTRGEIEVAHGGR